MTGCEPVDPITVDCEECRLFSPLPLCDDDTCGCSDCERIRSERESLTDRER